MADQKLSELPSVGGLTSSDLIYIVQNGLSQKISAAGFAVSMGDLMINPGTVAHSTSVGVAGTISYDTSYLYICVTSNTWIRTTVTTNW